MFYAIQGLITHKEPTLVVLKTQGGVSYALSISLFCAARLEKGREIELYTTPLFKEDSQRLFGFLDKAEQQMFELLLKVNGIGASIAMAVCSTLDSSAFYKALSTGDESAFKAVPGIGAKVAKRVITELGDKKAGLNLSDDSKSQALQALITLGFKQDKALESLAKCESKDTGELVKEALKRLS